MLFRSKGVNAPIATWDSRLSELRLAARQAVEGQIASLRRVGFAVDHVFPKTFEQLLYDWMVSSRLCVSEVLLRDGVGTDTARYFACEEQERSWQAFHKTHAVLETITHDEHAKRTQRAHIDWTSLL